MKLAHAIRKNVASLAQAQNTYKDNVITVNTLVTSVLTSSLPTLNTNPPDWNDYVSAYTTAKSDALDWVNNVMARLLDVPDEVQNYNPIISQLLNDAQTQASILKATPGNASALAILNNDLNALSSQLNLVVTFISGAVTNIQQFQDKLPDMAAQLQSIATKSSNDANADQKQIDSMVSQINALQADIKSLTAAIIALAVVDGIALTIGTVATIALWPEGALVWLVLGPAVLAATTVIALDGIKITQDKDKIAVLQSQMTGITADVSTLHILSNSFGQMATQAAALQTNLQAILAEWQTLESDVNSAITEIRTAISDTSSSNFSAVLDDINDAIGEWNDAYNQAGALHLDLQVNNASLQLGMSESDIQAALNGGTTIGVIEYYNQLGAAPGPVAAQFRNFKPSAPSQMRPH